jgi:hypothetical protein
MNAIFIFNPHKNSRRDCNGNAYFFFRTAAGSVTPASAPPETAQKYRLATLPHGDSRRL